MTKPIEIPLEIVDEDDGVFIEGPGSMVAHLTADTAHDAAAKLERSADRAESHARLVDTAKGRAG